MSVATRNPFAILDGRSPSSLPLLIAYRPQMMSPSSQRQRSLQRPLQTPNPLPATPKSNGAEVLLRVAASTIPEEERLK